MNELLEHLEKYYSKGEGLEDLEKNLDRLAQEWDDRKLATILHKLWTDNKIEETIS